MNMSTQLTYPGIGLAVFAEQLFLPVPAMVLLITVGALASQGVSTDFWLTTQLDRFFGTLPTWGQDFCSQIRSPASCRSSIALGERFLS
jgi:hypothetical protein